MKKKLTHIVGISAIILIIALLLLVKVDAQNPDFRVTQYENDVIQIQSDYATNLRDEELAREAMEEAKAAKEQNIIDADEARKNIIDRCEGLNIPLKECSPRYHIIFKEDRQKYEEGGETEREEAQIFLDYRKPLHYYNTKLKEFKESHDIENLNKKDAKYYNYLMAQTSGGVCHNLNFEKHIYAMAMAETKDCTLGYGAEITEADGTKRNYNNCFGIKGGNTVPDSLCKETGKSRMCIFDSKADAYEAARVLWSQGYNCLYPSDSVISTWTGNDRVWNWKKTYLQYYNQ